PANQCQRDSDKRCSRSHRIDAMMPGVCLNSAAFYFSSKSNDITKQKFLYDDCHHENRQRPWSGRVVRKKDFAHTLDCQTAGAAYNATGKDYSRDWLGLAVAIWMRLIRRSRGDC